MRIVHVIDSLGPGGAEHSLVNLVTRWQSRTHVVVALGPPYDLAAPLQSAGIVVHRLGMRRPLVELPAVIARLGYVLRSAQPDIVRGYLTLGGLATALSQPFAPSPLRVVSFHGLDYDAFPARTLIQKLIKRTRALLLRRSANGWVGISEAVARHYKRELGLDLEVIHNPFLLEDLHPTLNKHPDEVLRKYLRTKEDFVLIMPARYSREKGHSVVLEALAFLKSRGRPAHALFFGHGPLQAALQRRSGELGVADQVSFHGAIPQTELFDAIRACNALVLPTPDGEGFGRVAAEAMALGKPVIASRIGGVLDFIVHGSNGLLVEPRSSSSLADAIESVMLDPGLCQALGVAARQTVIERFGVDVAITRWEAYFDALRNERPGSPAKSA